LRITKNNYLIILVSGLVLIFVSGFSLGADFFEHTGEGFVSVYDLQGNYLFSTARIVTKGDRYISEDNIEYVVERVEGRKALARKMGKIDLLKGVSRGREELSTDLAITPNKVVAIFHTHNDESYKPGKATVKGRGDIHDVGEVLKKALEEKGIRAIHNEDLHLPHDGMAYERSRATVIDLLKENPDVILDIHRDGIPHIEEYLEKIEGKSVSQIRLVVGRQNPNYKANDQFARHLKASADELYPGLVKDIFYGAGNYNQQMAPNFILMEFGTYVNNKEQALLSAQLLAEPLQRVLTAERVGINNRPIFLTIFVILILAIAGILGYLYLNEGSWQGVLSRLKDFLPQEFPGRKGD